MDYIQGADRYQTHLFPASLEEYVSSDNPVRFIDAYVESLDVLKLGFTHARLAATGRPPYRPQDLLKLYIYGYLHRIRSSRGLERETHRNIELLWLLGKLQPDFKTIADFRKNNTEALKGTCAEFILVCKRMDLFGGELVAIDGSKFEAVNHSSASYTRKGLQQALAATGQQLQQWLEQLDQADHDDPSGPSGQDLSQKIAQLETYRGKLEELDRRIEDSREPGGSLTDPDSRKMRTGHGGSDVSYNVQIAVDSTHKLIVAHRVSSEATDLHQLLPMARQVKATLGIDTLEVVADKGYYNTEQIAGCQAEHIRCYVPAPQGNGGQSKDLFCKKDFTYLPTHDGYRCPAGEFLPYKSTVNKQGKRTRIYETSACQRCPLRGQCTTAKKGNRRMYRWIHEGIIEGHKERSRQNPEKIKLRGQLAEHPFGTLKRAMGAGYFLTKGLENVSGEMSLSILAYNMKRVLNIMGIAKLMEAVKTMEKSVRSFLIPFYQKYRQNYLIPYFNVSVGLKSL
ncbi:MAG: IS1182 family transposase [Gracilimonas sp.]|nr:IS1182 family transposase [Gracilimonas sp.]